PIFRWRTRVLAATIAFLDVPTTVSDEGTRPPPEATALFSVPGPIVTGPDFREDVSSMLATLSIATALSVMPAQTCKLKLPHPRTTYGFLGNVREKNKFLPGDVLFLAFDIDGMSVGKRGDIKYSLALEMKDASGAKVFAQLPQVIEAANTLGGASLPGY